MPASPRPNNPPPVPWPAGRVLVAESDPVITRLLQVTLTHKGLGESITAARRSGHLPAVLLQQPPGVDPAPRLP